MTAEYDAIIGEWIAADLDGNDHYGQTEYEARNRASEANRVIAKNRATDDMRIVKTSGGSIDVERGQIVGGWCRQCKRSVLPLASRGLRCTCGAMVATRAEIDEAIRKAEQ